MPKGGGQAPWRRNFPSRHRSPGTCGIGVLTVAGALHFAGAAWDMFRCIISTRALGAPVPATECAGIGARSRSLVRAKCFVNQAPSRPGPHDSPR